MTETPARQPLFNLPGAATALIGVLLLIQLGREALPAEAGIKLLTTLAFIPARLTFAVAPDAVADVLTRMAEPGGDPQGLAAAAGYLLDGGPHLWTLLTYALLHGDWAHVGLNSVWLAAFGAPVARRFGSRRFLALFAVASIAGALTHYAFHRFGLEPVIGASAGVSGLMGAAIRFVFHADAPLGGGEGFAKRREAGAYHGAAAPLAVLLQHRQVVLFIAVWFVINLGVGLAGPLGLTNMSIAWEAHVGGFFAGLLMFGLFDPVVQGAPTQDDGAL